MRIVITTASALGQGLAVVLSELVLTRVLVVSHSIEIRWIGNIGARRDNLEGLGATLSFIPISRRFYQWLVSAGHDVLDELLHVGNRSGNSL